MYTYIIYTGLTQSYDFIEARDWHKNTSRQHYLALARTPCTHNITFIANTAEI